MSIHDIKRNKLRRPRAFAARRRAYIVSRLFDLANAFGVLPARRCRGMRRRRL